jgi:hypothetical protein
VNTRKGEREERRKRRKEKEDSQEHALEWKCTRISSSAVSKMNG